MASAARMLSLHPMGRGIHKHADAGLAAPPARGVMPRAAAHNFRSTGKAIAMTPTTTPGVTTMSLFSHPGLGPLLSSGPPLPLRGLHALARAGLLLLAGTLAGCNSSDDPPPVATAVDDSLSVSWEGSSRLDVLANDSVSGGTASLRVATEPRNGLVSLVEGALVYTPDVGYFGPDEFSYRLGVDTASSTATVKLVVEAQFALQGVVTDGPIANARVQASVGSQTFSADADASGRYSVAVRTSQPADFITLTGTGVGAQSAVVLTSHVGEAGGLAAQVRNGTLTAENAPALMVTHLSAAQAGLMAQAGAVPRNNAELAAAAQQLDSNAVLYAAALVRLVVDGGVALPDGVASTRELLQSASALTAFQTARRVADRAQLEAAFNAALTDPSLARAPAGPAAGAEPVVLRYGYGAGGGTATSPRVTLRADGTATVVSSAARTAQWRREGAALLLTYDTPVVSNSFTNSSTPPFDQYPTEMSETGLRLSDLGASNGLYALASMTSVGYTVIQSGPQAGRTDFANTTQLRRYTVAAPALSNGDFPVDARIAGLTSERPPAGAFVPSRQDVLRITGPGTGTMERTGAAAFWRVIDGALLVETGTLATRYVPVGTGPLGEARWATEMLDTAGAVISHREVSVVRASAVSMAVADWAKPWVGNLNAAAGLQLATEFQANGRWGNIGANRGELLPAVTNFSRYWRQLPDGRLEMVSTVGGCDPFVGAASCRISIQRFWTPVARVGRTVWLLERLIGSASDPTGPGTDIRFVAFTERLPGS